MNMTDLAFVGACAKILIVPDEKSPTAWRVPALVETLEAEER